MTSQRLWPLGSLGWLGLSAFSAFALNCTASTFGDLPPDALGTGGLGSNTSGATGQMISRAGDAGNGGLSGMGAASGGIAGQGGHGGAGTVGTFEPLSVPVYLAKVKGLLTGLAPTAKEIAQVTADPSQLKALIASWQTGPEYQRRMRDFFTSAFQQGDLTSDMIVANTPFQQGALDGRVVQNMRESFGRTVLQLIEEGAPFTDVLTTTRFMMTPPMMMAMAWLDERKNGDEAFQGDDLEAEFGSKLSFTMQPDPLPLEQSLDPKNPKFLTFYSPQIAAATGGCRTAVTVTPDHHFTLYNQTWGEELMALMLGNYFQTGLCVYHSNKGPIPSSDFSNWRMVNIRQPKAGEQRTWVTEYNLFRTGSEIVLTRPHVGFYTTPAFLYTWASNTSNQFRVTANQTMIAAVGQQFDGSLTANPVSDKAVAKEHARPGTDCYNCHITMDPMRMFFRSTFLYTYSAQPAQAWTDSPGIFAFDGQSHVGTNIADLGKSLGANAHFATSWAHKLCTWANGAVCDPSGSNKAAPTDPEFLRVVSAFKDSHYSWNVLVQELLSSPLVTYAASTKTSEANGISLSVTKRAQLCQYWDVRLGLNDVCGLNSLPSTDSGDAVKTIATVLPADTYARGQTLPALANDPGMFFFASVESICTELAGRVVDVSTNDKYKSSASDAAISALVHDLMGIAAADDAEPIAILSGHFQAAKAAGKTASEALKSTFTLACLSPSLVSVGQ